jgi:hypothetical protein
MDTRTATPARRRALAHTIRCSHLNHDAHCATYKYTVSRSSQEREIKQGRADLDADDAKETGGRLSCVGITAKDAGQHKSTAGV